MRQIWLVNPTKKTKWNLSPDDTTGSVGILYKPKGMGYQSNLTTKQINFYYFLSEITSENTNIYGTLIFTDDDALKRFKNFVGDFSTTLELHYSPDGSVVADDIYTPSWFKEVIITSFDVSEKNANGVYEIPIKFQTLSDVWKRYSVIRSTEIKLESSGQNSYPYFFKYNYGGGSKIAVDINNNSHEVGCVVSIKNISSDILVSPEWLVQYSDGSTEQMAKFLVYLDKGQEIKIDSNDLSQSATFISSTGSETDINQQQEPSWDYINYIRLKNGKNRVIFLLNSNTVESKDISVSISYTEQTEIAY